MGKKNTSINSPKTKQNPKLRASASLYCFNGIVWSSLDFSSAVSWFTRHHSHHSLLILFIYQMPLSAFSEDMWLLGCC